MGFFKRRKERAALEKVLEDVNVSGGLEQLSENSSGNLIMDRCERLMQNAREIDDGKKEYYIVTSYLNDIELIENLLPTDLTLVKFLPLFVGLILYRGSVYMSVRQGSEFGFLCLSAVAVIVVPIVLYSILSLIIS